MKAKYGEKNERRSQLRALADFLEGIAGTLERMEKSLRNDVVPTADGHRLEEIVGEFASLIQRAPLDSKWKKKAEATRAQLQLHLRSGEILDDIIRGYVLEGPPDTKANLLHGMVETSLPRTGPGNVSVHAAVVIPIQTSDSEKPP